MNQVTRTYMKISQEQREKVLYLRGMGLSIRNVAKRTGLKEKTVASIKFVDRQSEFTTFESIMLGLLKQQFYYNSQVELLKEKPTDQIKLKYLRKQIRSKMANVEEVELQNEMKRLEDNRRPIRRDNRKIINKIADNFLMIMEQDTQIISNTFTYSPVYERELSDYLPSSTHDNEMLSWGQFDCFQPYKQQEEQDYDEYC